MRRAGHPLGMTGPFSWFYWWEAAAKPVGAGGRGLFLLPGGRPRRFGVISDIQFGGRPGPRPRPRARRSRLRIASSICSLSAFSSARILLTSIKIVLLADLRSASSRPRNYNRNGASLPGILSKVYLNLPDLQDIISNFWLEFHPHTEFRISTGIPRNTG